MKLVKVKVPIEKPFTQSQTGNPLISEIPVYDVCER